LQELTPAHFTFASSALTVLTAAENITAAAAARATLDSFFEVILESPLEGTVARRGLYALTTREACRA
jgi:hypothetical protein